MSLPIKSVTQDLDSHRFQRVAFGYDEVGNEYYPLNVNLAGLLGVANYYWNTQTLDWEAGTGSGTSGGTVNVQEYAEKIEISGVYIYEARATAGSAESSSVWQVKRTDTTGPIKVLWADGNQNFDNAATSLSTLTYS